MKIIIMNGPNLNLLGIREPGIYGRGTLEDIKRQLEEAAGPKGIHLEFYQSNHEGSLIDKIQECYGCKDGIIINPGAYTHYSFAIRDAIAAVGIPTIEVHLSDIHNREDFRKISVIKDVCVRQIYGKGIDSYLEALNHFSVL